MAKGDRILHVHSHLALDDVRSCAGPSPGTIQPDLDHHLVILGNTGEAGNDEFNIGRWRNLNTDGRTAVDHPDSVDECLHIFNRIAIMKREGRDEADAFGHSA